MLSQIRRTVIFLYLILLFCFGATAQKLTVDQLKGKINSLQRKDTARVNLLNELARRSEIPPSLRDSLLNESIQLSHSLSYLAGESFALTVKALHENIGQGVSLSKKAVAIAQKSNDKKSQFWAYWALGQTMLNTSENVNAIDPFRQALNLAIATNNPELIASAQLSFVDYYKSVTANYPVALEWCLKALQTAEQHHDTLSLPGIYRNIGAIYLLLGDQEKSLTSLQKALATSKQIGDYEIAQYALNDMGEQYRLTGKYAEALKAYSEAALLIKDSFNIELNQSNVADVYQRMGNNILSFEYGFKSLAGAKSLKDTIGIAWISNILSRTYLHAGKTDSAIYYAKQGYEYAIKTQVPEYVRDNSEALSNAYSAKQNFEQAFNYYRLFISSRDSIMSTEITNKAQLAQYNYDIEKKQTEIVALNKDKELQAAKVSSQRLLLIGSVLVILLILISLITLSQNISKRKKAYQQLHKQTAEIQAQRDQINQALNELKLTQAQLIQSEKMASLGELTAGIAHEIQNPLNFINNFSEVSNELMDEMSDELDKDDIAEAKVIAHDIKQNLEKINHHGKRADAIVKGMLQHSRSSNDKKEPTDINALADEYLRLSYHGLRAKDKSFNAKMETDFDESIGRVQVLQQDLGRVLLNLFTNAFYAVNEKKKQLGDAFSPTISVSTKRVANEIEIVVKDNGIGIPEQVIDKIYQPFFTTKPTGQGTGLGLSLSYDIVKAHGGKIRVETAVGNGSVFTIVLPA